MIISKANLELIRRACVFSAFFVLLSGIFLLSQWPTSSDAGESLPANISEPVQQLPAVQEPLSMQDRENVLDYSSILAESAFSVEFSVGTEEKVLFEKDKDQKLPIASLTKLMTALVILKTYDLDKQTIVSKEAMSQVGEQGNLKEGEVVSIGNLLRLILIESSNRAAFAASEIIGKEIFIELMNEQAKELGLLNTYFADSTGLDGNTYSTTRDLTKLTKHLFLNYPLFANIISLKEYDFYLTGGTFHHRLINTNELLGRSSVIGGKTGYTPEARGCFMTIQNRPDGKYVINIVLGAEDRFFEMEKLLSLTSNN